MSDSETITVADVSAGQGGGDAEPGTPVDLPVVELLTGRGLITGKSGSGKSNSASVLIEELLAKGFPVLVVDTDGEYYGLKEEFELLHAGADDECDIRVTPEHAGKLAELALEGNVPIVLDVSGYLDEDVASELVRETARHLFAKEKKLKKPFLMLVEECHEYVPEGGGLDETGRMLVKVGKRGRKHGLGIVGISQRPANVKKDFITQCDWLVWHRLTWDNDTKVVRRIIDREHADAVEDLADGEAFLMTDWSESVRRVQFRRKRTFDAGATPGLEDVERPDLKSVSDDLVDELREISAERERRESELADLRTELEEREARIRELERELEQARDLERMADRFSQALLRRAEAPHRTEGAVDRDGGPTPDDVDGADGDDARGRETDEQGRGADDTGEPLDARPPLADAAPWPDPHADDTAADGDSAAPVASGGGTGDGRSAADPDARTDDRTSGSDGDPDAAVGAASGGEDRSDSGAGGPGVGGTGDEGGTSDGEAADRGTAVGTREALVADLAERIEALDPVSRGMLAHYRAEGPAEPVAAHLAGGGVADREVAYSRNRTLRTAGLVRHVERGTYDYALPALVREEGGSRLRDGDIEAAVREIEAAFVARDADAESGDGRDRPVRDGEDADVEFVGDVSGDGGPAFREDDAEFVDEADTADGRADGRDDARERADDGAHGGSEEAVVMEETVGPSDGLADRNEEARDAEFVE